MAQCLWDPPPPPPQSEGAVPMSLRECAPRQLPRSACHRCLPPAAPATFWLIPRNSLAITRQHLSCSLGWPSLSPSCSSCAELVRHCSEGKALASESRPAREKRKAGTARIFTGSGSLIGTISFFFFPGAKRSAVGFFGAAGRTAAAAEGAPAERATHQKPCTESVCLGVSNSADARAIRFCTGCETRRPHQDE